MMRRIVDSLTREGQPSHAEIKRRPQDRCDERRGQPAHLEVASTWAIRASVIRGSPGSMANGDGSDAPPASIRSRVPMGFITTCSLAIAEAKNIVQNIVESLAMSLFAVATVLGWREHRGCCNGDGGNNDVNSDDALSNAPDVAPVLVRSVCVSECCAVCLSPACQPIFNFLPPMGPRTRAYTHKKRGTLRARNCVLAS